MPRKPKGVHTSPEKAGIQNMPKDYVEKRKDSEETMVSLMPLWNRSFENRENYKGKWDEESMRREITNFFQYCSDYSVKPAKAGLALWLATSKQQIWDWEKHPEKYGFKSELISQASQVIEMSYIARSESFPTANIFLLKTSHGHVDASKLEISNTPQATTNEEVMDKLSKLGLDEK